MLNSPEYKSMCIMAQIMHTDKKENKIFLIYSIRKFRVEQLQSHI
jgi:hypothetical protein